MASAYGWGKNEILDNHSLDEVFDYLDLIKRRKLSNYLMQMAIVSNPHTKNPKDLFEQVQNELKMLEGSDIMDIEPERGAFDRLRSMMARSNKRK